MSKPTYLGDGVYASYDGFHIWLKTERTEGEHLIALDSDVLDSLLQYVERTYGVKITIHKAEGNGP